MIHSLVIIVVGFLATPYVVGWFMRLTDAGVFWARVLMVTWLWSFAYWGTFYHAKKVGDLFARLMKDEE